MTRWQWGLFGAGLGCSAIGGMTVGYDQGIGVALMYLGFLLVFFSLS